jgi:hypothetical protein
LWCSNAIHSNYIHPDSAVQTMTSPIRAQSERLRRLGACRFNSRHVHLSLDFFNHSCRNQSDSTPTVVPTKAQCELRAAESDPEVEKRFELRDISSTLFLQLTTAKCSGMQESLNLGTSSRHVAYPIWDRETRSSCLSSRKLVSWVFRLTVESVGLDHHLSRLE